MSDNPTPNDMPNANTEGEGTEADSGFEAITSQEQLDKVLSKRLERERAK